jgi:Fe-S-cluster-containing hydrogenase component 2
MISKEYLERGVAIIECEEKIPCDPCIHVCQAISKKDLISPPSLDYDRCTGCGLCVGICPGLAIFVVKVTKDKALITLPYEFLPVPKIGEFVLALDKEGRIKGKGLVKKVFKKDKTFVITIEVSKDLAMSIRNIRVHENSL